MTSTFDLKIKAEVKMDENKPADCVKCTNVYHCHLAYLYIKMPISHSFLEESIFFYKKKITGKFTKTSALSGVQTPVENFKFLA